MPGFVASLSVRQYIVLSEANPALTCCFELQAVETAQGSAIPPKSPSVVSPKQSVSKPGFPPSHMPLLGKPSIFVHRISEEKEQADASNVSPSKQPFLPTDEAHEVGWAARYTRHGLVLET